MLAWKFPPTVKWAVKTLACYRPAHKRLVTSEVPRVAWFRPALPLSRCWPGKRAAVPVAWHGGPVLSLETEHLPSVVQENVHLEVKGGPRSLPACCSLSAISHYISASPSLKCYGIRGHGGSWEGLCWGVCEAFGTTWYVPSSRSAVITTSKNLYSPKTWFSGTYVCKIKTLPGYSILRFFSLTI